MRRSRLRNKLQRTAFDPLSDSFSVEHLPACHSARICLMTDIRRASSTQKGASSRCRQWMGITLKCAQDLTKDIWIERAVRDTSHNVSNNVDAEKGERKEE